MIESEASSKPKVSINLQTKSLLIGFIASLFLYRIVSLIVWLIFILIVIPILILILSVYFIKPVKQVDDAAISEKFPQFSFIDSYEQHLELINLNHNRTKQHDNDDELDLSINEIIDLVIRDFIKAWFTSISEDENFPIEVKYQLTSIINELKTRLSNIDFPNFLVIEILPLITKHYTTFVNSYETVIGEENLNNLTGSDELNLKIANEFNLIKPLHKFISIKNIDNFNQQEIFSRDLAEKIIPKLIYSNEINSLLNSILIRELLTNLIFLPVIKMITESDFWNQLLINIILPLLKDRDQVREVKNIIDKEYNSSNGESTTNSLLSNKITPSMKQQDFEKYLRNIISCQSIPMLKQLKYFVNVQITRILKINSKSEKFIRYKKRLFITKELIDKKLKELGDPNIIINSNDFLLSSKENFNNYNKNLSLEQILNNPSYLSIFMEFMEQRKRLILLQYWLTVNGIKDPLENPNDTDLIKQPTQIDENSINDIKSIFNIYFNIKILKIDMNIYKKVNDFIRSVDSGNGKYDLEEYIEVRNSILLLQNEILKRMEKTDLNDFKKSDYFLKLLANDSFFTSYSEEGEDENVDDELEEIEKEDMSGKNNYQESLIEDEINQVINDKKRLSLKQDLFGQEDKPFLDEKRKLFDDDDYDYAGSDNQLNDPELEPNSSFEFVPNFYSKSHHLLNLKQEIKNIDDEIDGLNKKCKILDSLILKNELIDNSNELRILRKSKDSFQREIESKELMKQQLIIQDNDTSLFGGNISIIIDSWVKAKQEKKDFILFIIKIEKSDESNVNNNHSWIIGRRFNQFFELNEYLTKQYPKQLKRIEFPKKTIIIKLQQKYLINERRIKLEKYLKELIKIPEICSNKVFREFLTIEDFSISASGSNSSEVVNKFDNPEVEDSEFKDEIETFETYNNNGGISVNSSGSINGTGKYSTKSFVKPIIDLIISMFTINKTNQWLRGKAIIVVLQQIFGSTIEKHIKEIINNMIKRERMVVLVKLLKSKLWINDLFFSKGERDIRSFKDKNDSKQECKMLLQLLMNDFFSKIVGEKNSKVASLRIHLMIQNEKLNNNLIFEIFDKIVENLF